MKQTAKRPASKRRLTQNQKVPLLLVFSFGGGVGAAALLLCLFAMLLTKTAIPMTLVQPMACAAAGIGAAVSGLILAAAFGKQRLLCGLGCGAFYAACLLVVCAATGRGMPLGANGATVPAAMILGGLLGGAVSALRSPS